MKIKYKEAHELKENDIVFIGMVSTKTSYKDNVTVNTNSSVVYSLRIKKILGLNTEKDLVGVEVEQIAPQLDDDADESRNCLMLGYTLTLSEE